MPLPLLFGPYGSAAIEYADQFADYGANACWFHGFDATAFDACERHNIAACVEFKTFRADFNTHPEWIPTGIDGKPIRYGNLVQGVCLSQTGFLEETEANLLAGLKAFQPTGIWLDYLTYAGWFETPAPDLQESCFCPACVTEFCNTTGIDADTPAEILAHHQHAWTRRKTERVAGYAHRYADLVHQHLPDCVIGAYMCPWTPDEFDGALSRVFAQDYDLLAPAIDIFTPLIYVKKSGRRFNWGQEWLRQASNFVPANRKVQLILDALDFPNSLVSTAEAEHPSYGLQMFGGADIFRDEASAEIFRVAVVQMRMTLERAGQINQA